MVQNVPVTSSILRESYLRGDLAAVNRCGIIILGLARPQGAAIVEADVELCSILLIGFVPHPESASPWCEDENTIKGIFRLANLDDSPTTYTDVFIRFLQLVEVHDPHICGTWNSDDVEACRVLTDFLTDSSSVVFVPKWYGVIFKSFGEEPDALSCFDSLQVSVNVIESNRQPGTRATVLAGCTMSLQDSQRLREALAKSPGDLRNLQHALGVAPWYDVQSDGYSLVKAVVYFGITAISVHPEAHLLYKRIILSFSLWLTERQAATLSADFATPERTDPCMRMLGKVASKAAKLVRQGWDAADVERRCEKIRSKVEQVAVARARCVSGKYTLPMMHEGAVRCPDPTIRIKDEMMDPRLPNEDPDRSSRAWQNLALLPSLAPTASFERVLSWVHSPFLVKSKSLDARLILFHIERVVFQRSDDFESLTVTEVPFLEKLVDEYRVVVDKVKQSSAGAHRCELQSQEVLVTWVAYCLIHNLSQTSHSVLRKFGVALNAHDVRHLVLAEKRAIDVMLRVHAYLVKHTLASREVFSLRCEALTYIFAEQISRGDENICRIWQEEQNDAARRVEAHWAEVRRKQQLAAKLRIEIQECRSQLSSFQSELNIVVGWMRKLNEARQRLQEASTSRTRYAATGLLSNAQQAVDAARPEATVRADVTNTTRTLQSKEQALADAEKPPPSVYQPLPEADSLAYQALFFLYMPPMLRSLSRMSFLAQQMLVPWPLVVQGRWDIKALCEVPNFQTSWAEYYTSKQLHNQTYHTPATERVGTDGSVLMLSRGTIPQELQISGSHVDRLTQPSCGVWHPDKLGFGMAWKTTGLKIGEGSLLDPFALVPDHHTVDYFTARLPASEEKFSWCLQMPTDISLERGNSAIALQCDRPDWLTKREFLAFGQLRSYPNLQLRKLCSALQDITLPLTHAAVQTLIRQSLYHVGPISEDGHPMWKTDMYKGELLQCISEQLQQLVDIHAEKRREHSAVLILAEIIAYFSQWHKGCFSISRKLSRSVYGWVQDVSSELVSAVPCLRDGLKVKRCLFSMLSLLCHSQTELSCGDAKYICCAVVLARNSMLCSSQDHAADSGIQAMMDSCHHMMVRRISEITQRVAEDLPILTHAVRLMLEHTPDGLSWCSIPCESSDMFSACYEAICPAGHLYSINLLNGVVLLDGNPPGVLPQNILDHPLYIRTFGKRTFDVSLVASQTFKTSYALDGCFYEFLALPEGKLHIRELSSQFQLELLDPAMIGEELPVRLRELHSHWLWREKNILVLRPTRLHEPCDRSCAYFLKLDHGACFRVPEPMKNLPITDLSESNAIVYRLVQCRGDFINVLAKFEASQYIHTFVRTDEEVPEEGMAIRQIEFPRYRMTFEIKDGQVLSRDYRGYRLANHQQMRHALPEFTQYLVLERINPDETSLPAQRVLVPDGAVCFGRPVIIGVSENSEAALQAFRFSMHPRLGLLEAEGVLQRLQLAALYLATGSLLLDCKAGMSGVEASMVLMRQCWSHQPLSLQETEKLANVLSLCSNSFNSAGLEILCREVYESSKQLSFLHDVSPPELGAWARQAKTVKEYCWMAKREPQNVRRLLEDSEERRIMGVCTSRGAIHVESDTIDSEELLGIISLSAYIPHVETQLTNAVRQSEKRPQWLAGSKPPTFPIDKSKYTTPLASEIVSDLQQSWEFYHNTPESEVCRDSQCISPESLEVMRNETQMKRAYAYDGIMKSLDSVPSRSRRATAFRLLRVAGAIPCISPFEVFQIAWRTELVKTYNPFLSSIARERLCRAVLVYLQLCVLEDRLGRLLTHARAGAGELLLQELQVCREWDVRKYPEWLVFEAVGGLQIRPTQYRVAMKVMEDPGALVQLNMGQGKTRVIVPMLLLEWAQGHIVVRVNVLSQLFHDMYAFLHQNLCATVLLRKVFVMPFNRDVELTVPRVALMRQCLNYCSEVGGVLLVAPEHRLSLELKWHELRSQEKHEVCSAMDQLWQIDVHDLLDECDELLHHRWQLVYAVGAQVALPDGEPRWHAVQAIFRVTQQNSVVAEILSRPNVAERVIRGTAAFDVIRLVPGPALDDVTPELYGAILDAVVADLPYEFGFLQKYTNNQQSAVFTALRTFILDPSVSDECLPILPVKVKTICLALRGILACGVLCHCMQKRHRVDYGINRNSATRLAVPFRASDTPAERSEFGHADCAIEMTILSYYYDGLSIDEVQSAFAHLMKCGPRMQSDLYESWFKQSQGRMPEEDKQVLSRADMIDVSNQRQMQALYAHYRFNTETINFWLNHCVLPVETAQHPQKLVANSVNLADNKDGLVSGFSGTNDSPWLPVQVTQKALPDLLGTNGKMLQIITNNETYHCLGDAPVLWQAVLDLCLKLRVHALMDSGALTSGKTNLEVAEYIMQHLDIPSLCGAIFFDATAKQWMILDRHGQCQPKHISAVREHECFAFFDEARTRGADLKLGRGAVGLVTVGPKMSKAKLVQAIGRFRMLESGQKLCFAGSKEVTTKIRQSCNLPLGSANASTTPPPGLPLDKAAQEAADAVMARAVKERWQQDAQMAGARLFASFAFIAFMACAASLILFAFIASLIFVVLSWQFEQSGRHAGNMLEICWKRIVEACWKLVFIVKSRMGDQREARGVLSWAWPSPTKTDSRCVLRWALQNTVEAEERALPEWVKQHALFATTRGAPERAHLDEVLDLQTFYGGSQAPQAAVKVARHHVDAYLARVPHGQVGLAHNEFTMIDRILEKAETYGQHVQIVSTVFESECERELDKDVEREPDRIAEIKREAAAPEADWDYSQALVISGPEELPITILRLDDVTRRTHQLRDLRIQWPVRVCCTENFVRTVQANVDLDDFLRPVDVAVVFETGEWLLLSEREADAILSLFWSHESDKSMWFVNVALAHCTREGAAPRLAISPGYGLRPPNVRADANQMTNLLAWFNLAPAAREARRAAGIEVLHDDEAIATMQLFMGECCYPTSSRRRALVELLCIHADDVQMADTGAAVAERLVRMRGMSHFFERSDLRRVLFGSNLSPSTLLM
jgi:hypothetical protein